MREEESKEKSAFQNLLVWQKSMEAAKQVYILTKSLPKEEQFGLTSQMRRCAVSIPSNIAEGAKRGKKEFVRFLKIANGSAAELETQLILAEELYEIHTKAVRRDLTGIQKMLESLIKKV